MTDEVGIWEHADHAEPRKEHGYCTDDNARALIVVCAEPNPGPDLVELAGIYVRFLADARTTGGFHNRRDRSGAWIDQMGSEDSQGRAMWALGFASRHAPLSWMRQLAAELFDGQAGLSLEAPRSVCFQALGAAEVLGVDPGQSRARRLLLQVPAQIRASANPSWPWPEPRLAYDNARLPEALIAVGHLLGDDDALDEGLHLLGWLAETETIGDRFSFAPVGGWAPGEPKPGFDQQPIEAAAMAGACHRALEMTGDPRWSAGLERAVGWFLGRNDSSTPLYESETGGGRDGLTPDGANQNQGAESTLAALRSLQLARDLR